MSAGTETCPTTSRLRRRLLVTALQATVVGALLATTAAVLLRPQVLTVPLSGAAPGASGLVVTVAGGATDADVSAGLSVTNEGPSTVRGFDASVLVTGRPVTVTAVAACPRPWTDGADDAPPTCAAGARQVGDPGAGDHLGAAGDVIPVHTDAVLPPGGALYLRLTVVPTATGGGSRTAAGVTTVRIELADT